MVDACTVQRATGETTIDPDTLAEVPVYATVWSGPCRIQRSGSTAAREVSGATGYEFGVGTVLAQLPIASAGIKRGDVLEVTAVGPDTDPDLLGAKSSVQANLTKTHATKRTLICEEVT
jgi:hypothetical protein